MSNKKSIMRALVLCGLAMLMSISMLAGTTFAWFTDSVESGTNKIVAGNLDVEVNYYDEKIKDWADVQGATTIFDENAHWEPGYTEVIYFQVKNVGNLAIKYRLALNILGQVIGQTKDGQDIRLSDYINFGIVRGAKNGEYATREEAIAAIDEVHTLSEVADGDTYAFARRNGEIVAGGEDNYFALVVWMPTEVGNEANHDGTHIPSIDLDISLVATQYTDEKDSFDNQYDKDAKFPVIGSGTATFTVTDVAVEVQVRNEDSSKIASLVIDKDSMSSGVKDVKVDVKETELMSDITVQAGQKSKSFDIDVEGLKANNDVPVKVMLRIEPNLDINDGDLTVYHGTENGSEVVTDRVSYNPHTGYVTFYTTSFSPFAVVYGTGEYEPVINFDGTIYGTNGEVSVEDICTRVEEYENTVLEWGSYGQWSPTAGLDSNLEGAFQFTCPEDSLDNVAYADWYCDFYVKINTDLAPNQIFLGGNYGTFGWVGFHNGDMELKADTELPILGSVITNDWTYREVYNSVGTFICGVGDVDNALAGKTFTVMLRLTNPENENEFYNVVTVEYTFGNTNPSTDGEVEITGLE